jgi:acetylornithine/N-succinyldiaminopimelate aminotransferase
MFRVPGAELLAQRLVEHSFADAVFFTNSGTESVEAGLKAMRAYQAGVGQPQRNRIIGFKGSFHGRTMAAVAAAGNPAHCTPFIPSDYGFDSVPWGDLEALEAAIGPHTAGIVLEPVQGEGGVRPVPDETLRAIRKLCDQHGLLLMFDEVQCGAGRTGALFAHQLTDVTPDIMALAKGLGGGFPMGACLATSRVSDHMVMGTHGTTYGGNPLAVAVANKVLDLILEPKLLPSVRAKGEHLRSQLTAICAEYPEVFKEVTGRGLMVGLVCGPANTEVLASLRSHGILVGKAGGNMIRLLPPMNISQAHLDKAIDTIRRVAAGWNIGS